MRRDTVNTRVNIRRSGREERDSLSATDRRALHACLLTTLLAGCATQQSVNKPAADVPAFAGEETEWWLVQETAPVGRDDVLPAFDASAQNYGCTTERLGLESSTNNIYGERQSYYGVTATCREGTIALITLVGGAVRIGCTKPTTREACDLLLRNISGAR